MDAVYSHFILCCHPNAIGMVNKTTEKRPNLVVISFPKDTVATKTISIFINTMLRIFGIFRRSARGRRWYAHSTNQIKSKFEENGYNLVFTEESFIGQTLVYEKSK